MAPAAVSTPCVTFLIRLPDTRQTDTSHARHRANRRPASPEDGPLGACRTISQYTKSHQSQYGMARIPAPPPCVEAPPNDFRRTFGFNHLAALPHRYSVQKKRHAGTTQIPVVSPTANPPRGTPSPRHSERGRRNATAPQHPGRHPPAIHRPTVTTPPCRRNQG